MADRHIITIFIYLFSKLKFSFIPFVEKVSGFGNLICKNVKHHVYAHLVIMHLTLQVGQ